MCDALQADAAQNGEELSEEERLLARMDVGLYSLQQCALIAGHLWFVGDIGVRKRILQLLHQKVPPFPIAPGITACTPPVLHSSSPPHLASKGKSCMSRAQESCLS